MQAVMDPITKSRYTTVYNEINCYEYIKTIFTKVLWNSLAQFRITFSIKQDKLTRQNGETMTSHCLRYPNLAEQLQV